MIPADTSETLLCEIAYRHGSDKCPRILHTYTPHYHRLFGSFRDRIESLLEIGIGNPATMNEHLQKVGRAYRPGASLRMWREYFPNAQIHGCDIDRNVLFEEDRIRTHYVDQSRTDSLLALSSRLDQPVDIILDDGSHEGAHMCTSLAALWPILKPDGFYIIEDIHRDARLVLETSPVVEAIKKDSYFFEYRGPSQWAWDDFWVFRKL